VSTDKVDGNLERVDVCGSGLETCHSAVLFRSLNVIQNRRQELRLRSPCIVYRHQIRPLRQTYHLHLPSHPSGWHLDPGVCLESRPKSVGVVDYMQQMQLLDPGPPYHEPQQRQPQIGLLVWYAAPLLVRSESRLLDYSCHFWLNFQP